MSAMEITIIVIVAVLVLALVVGGVVLWRHQSLQRRYGAEYQRLAEQEGRVGAERKLRERERQHAKLDLHDLDAPARERYRAAWTEVQTRFVDAPEEAIGAADDLITRLAAERGYPTENYQEQIEQLSVDHGRTLENYRFAHEVYLSHQRGEATTEQLREALVHYRVLFADMLGEDPVEHPDGHRADGYRADGRRADDADGRRADDDHAADDQTRSESTEGARRR